MYNLDYLMRLNGLVTKHDVDPVNALSVLESQVLKYELRDRRLGKNHNDYIIPVKLYDRAITVMEEYCKRKK